MDESIYTVGITATRTGLTVQQAEFLTLVLSSGRVVGLHHGDCVGGDADADRLAAALGISRTIHPPDNDALRAFCEGELILGPLPYLNRNRNIVHATMPLLAFPGTPVERKFGGTWGTVRYARSCNRPVLVCLPGGSLLLQQWRGLAGFPGVKSAAA